MHDSIEIWKPVVGYEGLYEVSSLGRVRSLDRIVGRYKSTMVLKGRIMSLRTRKEDGRKDVILCGRDRIHKRYKVHRLVAEAFIPNPDNLPEVNHKDEDPANNNAANLEWCDRWYNTHYGRYSEKISEATSKPIMQIKDGVVIKVWKNIQEASKHFSSNGTYTGNIGFGLKDNTKRPYGFEWRYAIQD